MRTPTSDSAITFTAPLWQFDGGKASWFFVTLPVLQAEQVRFAAPFASTHGWKSVRVEVTVGNTSWKTSLFPDKKSGSFVLPIKADIRQREHLMEGKLVSITLMVI